MSIVAEYDSSCSRLLHVFYGEFPFGGHTLFHGDWEATPAVRGTFAEDGKDGSTDTEARGEWLFRQVAESPDDDEQSIQGWTYVADYSVHRYTPNTPLTGQFYIHARIDRDNRLQFGVFRAAAVSQSVRKFPLAQIKNKTARQCRHGDETPPLRIATKEEAEAFMLLDGKLREEVCPRCAGVWMNWGLAKIRLSGVERRTVNGTTSEYPYGPHYSTIRIYGHIWSYWYTIVDNVLYFVGIPLYNSDASGSIVYTYLGIKNKRNGAWQYYSKRESVTLPPTEDDLLSKGFSRQRLRDDEFVSSPTLNFIAVYHSVFGAGFTAGRYEVGNMLRENCVAGKTPTLVCQRAIAKIESDAAGNFSLRQLRHGDIYANATAIGFNGGVFRDSTNRCVQTANVSHATTEDNISSSYSSGLSGYVASRTRYNLEGLAAYTAQAFYVTRYGVSYNIETKGAGRPIVRYSSESLGECDIDLHCNFVSNMSNVNPDPGVDDDDDDNPPPIPPPPDPGDIEEDDDPVRPSHPCLGELGYWYESGSGVSVTHSRDKSDMTTLKYTFTVTVNENITSQYKLAYEVTAQFSVADGGSYGVEQNSTVSMWYWLTGGGGTVCVHNQTSASWGYDAEQGKSTWVPNEHPTSETSFKLNVFRTAYMTAKFDVVDFDSTVRYASGNIISIVDTGRRKRVGGSIKPDSQSRSHYAYGYLKIMKVNVKPAICKQILNNYAASKAPKENCMVAPGEVRGNVNGAAAGDPVVTAGTATAKNVTKAPLPGATASTGPIQMYVLGIFDKTTAKYQVTSALGGWYEGTRDNAQSGTISGQFVVSVPGRRIYNEKV